MIERRQNQRSRAYLGATIAFSDGFFKTDCLLRSISKTGARLHLPRTNLVPREFDLDIRAKGETHRANVVWMNRTQAGVEFVKRVSSRPAHSHYSDNVVPTTSARPVMYETASHEDMARLARRIAQVTERGNR